MVDKFKNENVGSLIAVPCSELRMDGLVMMQQRPCKIVEMNTSMTGKHGHAKIHMVGIDIFNGNK